MDDWLYGVIIDKIDCGYLFLFFFFFGLDFFVFEQIFDDFWIDFIYFFRSYWIRRFELILVSSF